MTPIRVLTAEPQGRGIIALLEQLLSEARAGELSSIAIVNVNRDGSTNARWSDAPSLGLLLGAAARLSHKLNREMET